MFNLINSMIMYNVVLSQIGTSKQQLFDYFIANNFDTDKVEKFEQECDDMIAYTESELEGMQASQDYSDGSWSYGSADLDNWAEEQEKHLEDLKALRDNAQECYTMLDDYLAEIQ